jgi:hypothetical protein
MTQHDDYRAILHSWVVVQQLPNMQRVVRSRFRKGSDADGYARSLKRLIPNGTFVVVFDPPAYKG